MIHPVKICDRRSAHRTMVLLNTVQSSSSTQGVLLFGFEWNDQPYLHPLQKKHYTNTHT